MLVVLNCILLWEKQIIIIKFFINHLAHLRYSIEYTYKTDVDKFHTNDYPLPYKCSNTDAVGVYNSDISCNFTCDGGNNFKSACINHYKLIQQISYKSQQVVSLGDNEIIIKSWNYNNISPMSNNGLYYNSSSKQWEAEIYKICKSSWDCSYYGWNDVSNLSINKNIPLLAYGIAVPDKTIFTKQRDDIQQLYNNFSDNLDVCFNSYRKHHNISLIPYYIGLDISCQRNPHCLNPFFNLEQYLFTSSNEDYF